MRIGAKERAEMRALKRMPCVDCARVEECNAEGAEPFPRDPIPWGWSWAIGGARCERCLATTSDQPVKP